MSGCETASAVRSVPAPGARQTPRPWRRPRPARRSTGCRRGQKRAKQFGAIAQEHDAGDGGGQKQRPGVIDGSDGVSDGDRAGRRTDRPAPRCRRGNVDQKDRAPAEKVADRATQNRADGTGRHQHQAGIALVARPLRAGSNRSAVMEKIDTMMPPPPGPACSTRAAISVFHRNGHAAGDRGQRENRHGGDHHIFAAKEDHRSLRKSGMTAQVASR